MTEPRKPTRSELEETRKSLLNLHKREFIDFNENGWRITPSGLDIAEAFLLLDVYNEANKK